MWTLETPFEIKVFPGFFCTSNNVDWQKNKQKKIPIDRSNGYFLIPADRSTVCSYMVHSHII